MNTYEPVKRCRICGEPSLYPVLYLDHQVLTGVFPTSREQEITEGPLELVLCGGCSLVQLGHSYNMGEVYGESYGYRSGLNASMVTHLRGKASKLMRQRPLNEELVIDIGSNDGTFLSFFQNCVPVGIDPLANKFRHFYDETIEIIPSFFSEDAVRRRFQERKAAIITSIAMFYDLPDPSRFVRDVAALLAPDGIWHVEMSYLPLMLSTGSLDTICHEHLEYYSLSVLNNLFDRNGLKIVDAETNAVNGGSIALTVMHKDSPRDIDKALIRWMLEQDRLQELNQPWVYRKFCYRAVATRDNLRSLIRYLRAGGKSVGAIGASTKGNVLLQYCDFTSDDIDFVMDVNPEKHGRFTPGTLIPIVSEEEGRKRKPDYMLVPIWHFREGVIEREREYLANGGKLIFPLPRIEVVG